MECWHFNPKSFQKVQQYIAQEFASFIELEVLAYYSVQVVEISRGSKVKYELDKKTGLIKVQMSYLLWFINCRWAYLICTV